MEVKQPAKKDTSYDSDVLVLDCSINSSSEIIDLSGTSESQHNPKNVSPGAKKKQTLAKPKRKILLDKEESVRLFAYDEDGHLLCQLPNFKCVINGICGHESSKLRSKHRKNSSKRDKCNKKIKIPENEKSKQGSKLDNQSKNSSISNNGNKKLKSPKNESPKKTLHVAERYRRSRIQPCCFRCKCLPDVGRKEISKRNLTAKKKSCWKTVASKIKDKPPKSTANIRNKHNKDSSLEKAIQDKPPKPTEIKSNKNKKHSCLEKVGPDETPNSTEIKRNEHKIHSCLKKVNHDKPPKSSENKRDKNKKHSCLKKQLKRTTKTKDYIGELSPISSSPLPADISYSHDISYDDISMNSFPTESENELDTLIKRTKERERSMVYGDLGHRFFLPLTIRDAPYQTSTPLMAQYDKEDGSTIYTEDMDVSVHSFSTVVLTPRISTEVYSPTMSPTERISEDTVKLSGYKSDCEIGTLPKLEPYFPSVSAERIIYPEYGYTEIREENICREKISPLGEEKCDHNKVNRAKLSNDMVECEVETHPKEEPYSPSASPMHIICPEYGQTENKEIIEDIGRQEKCDYNKVKRELYSPSSILIYSDDYDCMFGKVMDMKKEKDSNYNDVPSNGVKCTY